MSADALLSRLDGVRETGRGRWSAKCPSHADSSPSLSVREMDDGRVLLHCFAGCGAADVLDALGLTWADVMPERLGDHLPRVRRPYDPLDVLRCCASEALIAAIGARLVADGVVLDDAERLRLFVAAGRLDRAREIADGR